MIARFPRQMLAFSLILSWAIYGPDLAVAGPRYFAYNNTVHTTFTGLSLAPAGTRKWGPNQALNDKDKSLEASERLALTGLSPGRYDVKLRTEDGRICILENVDLTKDNSFEIRDGQLADCH